MRDTSATEKILGQQAEKVVAIIPARGGSKGLPGKNIMDLCGKPLIAYSIEAALKASTVDRVIVSTDCEEIAAVARDWGAEVPFMRSASLACDDSHIGMVIADACDRLFGSRGGGIKQVILYPTSPFRTPGLIDFMVGKADEGVSTVHTVRRIPRPNFNYFMLDNAHPVPLLDETMLSAWHGFVRNYAVVTVTQNTIPRTNYVYAIEDEISLIDIDSLEDFLFAEEIMKAGMFDFDTPTPPMLRQISAEIAA